MIQRRLSIVIILVKLKTKILLNLRDSNTSVYPLHYAFISGGIRKGEMPSMCAKRELQEETSLRLQPKKVTTFRQVKEFSSVHLFTLSIGARDMQNVICHEGLGLGLAPIEKLKSKYLNILGLGRAPIAKPSPLYDLLCRYVGQSS